MEALYTAIATARGGRNGEVATDDGVVRHTLSIPKAMGGPGAAGATNPEQLFASGYAACFGSAVEFVARQPGLERAQAQALVEAAHQVCPYSNATRGNMDVALRVVE